MQDAFELCGEIRRPWIEAASMKEKFLRISSEFHPDRFHEMPGAEKEAATARYADLNAAFTLLREPRDRLLHLLELELGTRPRDIQRIPPGTMDLFVEVGQLCRDIDAHLAASAGSDSPMLRLGRMRAGLELGERLMALQTRINAQRDALLSEVQALNPVWIDAPPIGAADRAKSLPLERLEEIYRVLSYVVRWTGQIQERLTQLAQDEHFGTVGTQS